MFIYLASFSLIYLFINLFCICLHLSKKYVSENPKALFTYKCTAVSWRNINKAALKHGTAFVYISFRNCSTLYLGQRFAQAVLRLFSFLLKTAVPSIVNKATGF